MTAYSGQPRAVRARTGSNALLYSPEEAMVPPSDCSEQEDKTQYNFGYMRRHYVKGETSLTQSASDGTLEEQKRLTRLQRPNNRPSVTYEPHQQSQAQRTARSQSLTSSIGQFESHVVPRRQITDSGNRTPKPLETVDARSRNIFQVTPIEKRVPVAGRRSRQRHSQVEQFKDSATSVEGNFERRSSTLSSLGENEVRETNFERRSSTLSSLGENEVRETSAHLTPAGSIVDGFLSGKVTALSAIPKQPSWGLLQQEDPTASSKASPSVNAQSVTQDTDMDRFGSRKVINISEYTYGSGFMGKYSVDSISDLLKVWTRYVFRPSVRASMTLAGKNGQLACKDGLLYVNENGNVIFVPDDMPVVNLHDGNVGSLRIYAKGLDKCADKVPNKLRGDRRKSSNADTSDVVESMLLPVGPVQKPVEAVPRRRSSSVVTPKPHRNSLARVNNDNVMENIFANDTSRPS